MKSLYFRQIIFLILIFLAFLFIIGALIFSGTASAKVTYVHEDNVSNIKKQLIKYSNEDQSISRNEKIEGDVLITDGSLTVFGEIEGNIYALHSHIFIQHSALIYGNIICCNGQIKKEDGAKIGGDIVSLGKEPNLYIDKTEIRNIEGYKFPYFILHKTDEDIEYIDKDRTISGDLIAFDYTLDIAGKIDGDLITLFSKTQINNECVIDGHLINYNGLLNINPGALITGEKFIYSKDLDIARVEDEKDFEEETEIDEIESEDEEDEKIRQAVEKKFLHRKNKSHSDIVRFFGSVTVNEDERIIGSVVVMRGTAHILGEVNGDVVSIFGNVELDSTGYVSGDVVSVGGRIYREPESYIGGDVVQTSWTGVKVDDGDQHVEVGFRGIKVSPKNDDQWSRKNNTYYWNQDFDEFNSEPVLFRYNRVEGLVLGFQRQRNPWAHSKRHSELYGYISYGFRNKKTRYQIGFERWIFNKFRFTLGAEVHDMTDTEDKWIIPSGENSLAAFFMREDFHDYYRREGVSAYVIQNITPHLRFKVGYHEDRFEQMDRVTHWSLFGGSKKFRDNPLVDEIKYRSLRAEIGLDTRNSVKNPTQGWYVKLSGEFARPDLNKKEYKDIDFDRYVADFRRYQPIGYGENLDIRLRAGSARGIIPSQYKFDLGGLSTLRGYKYKEFQDGDRFLLGNLEYRMYGDEGILDFDDINLIFFTDAGLLWNSEDKTSAVQSFEHITWEDFKTSVGIALTNYDGNVRFNIAKRLDQKDKPIDLTFRIHRPF